MNILNFFFSSNRNQTNSESPATAEMEDDQESTSEFLARHSGVEESSSLEGNEECGASNISTNSYVVEEDDYEAVIPTTFEHQETCNE